MATIGGVFIAATLLAAATPGAALAAAKTTSTWSAPDLHPATYAKVLVLAKFSDDAARRTLEDALVKGLKNRGVNAVAGYEVLKPADLESREAIIARARELGADAGIVFKVTDSKTEAKPPSNVHASVGVGLGGYGGGFGLFVGTSVPLGGSEPKSITTVAVSAEFCSEGHEAARWIATFSTTLVNGAEDAARDIAGQALKQVKKAGIFPKK
jgi:hypothetical protein